MRVFVAGATGVIGRRAVAALVSAGHDVTGIRGHLGRRRSCGGGRRSSRGVVVRTGRTAGRGRRARCRREPGDEDPVVDPGRAGARWAENERIRVEGSRNLVDAALAADARAFVQESIAFVYGEHGDAWIDAATTPLAESPYTEAVRAGERRTVHPCRPRRGERRPRQGNAGRDEGNAGRDEGNAGAASCCASACSRRADSHHYETIIGAARRGVLLDVGARMAICPRSTPTTRPPRSCGPWRTHPRACTTSSTTNPSRGGRWQRALARSVGRRRLHRPPGFGLTAGTAGPLAASQRVSNAPVPRRYRLAAAHARPGRRDRADGRRGRSRTRARARCSGIALAARGDGLGARDLRRASCPGSSTTTSRSAGSGCRTTGRTTSIWCATSVR